jgi:hypothetical protein
MKTLFLKKLFATVTAVLLLVGLMAFPTFAEEAPSETADGAEVEQSEPYVVFYAEQMKDRMASPNPSTTYSFREEDGKTFLELGLSKEGNDPYVAFDLDGEYSTEVYKYATVFVKSETLTKSDFFSLFYATGGTDNKFVGGGRVGTQYTNIKGWQALTFDMTESEKWTGNLDMVRYDYFEGRGNGYTPADKCEIYALALSQTVEDIYELSFDIFCELYPPEQVISDFTDEDIASIAKSPLKTESWAKDGNWILYAPETAGDPSVMVDYQSLTKTRGIKTLTTEDFRYTVFRYRTSMNVLSPSIELFIMTGEAKSLMDMIRIEGTYSCHSGTAKYQNTRTWRGVMIDMAEDDGLEENTRLMYGWQGSGEFNGFRFDWCTSATMSSYMEISDMLMFADKADAQGFSEAICSLTIPLPITSGGEDETYETEHVVMPWETESETDSITETETLPVFSEETLPTFTEETEILTTETTETEIETETVEIEETVESEETEGESELVTEPDDSQGGDVGEFPGIDIEGAGTEEAEDTGSQVPFYIACVALAGLSVASTITVIIIRIKNK